MEKYVKTVNKLFLAGSAETSPKSVTSPDQSQDRANLMRLFLRDSKVTLRNSRYSKQSLQRLSIELGSSTDSIPMRPPRKRPPSLVVSTRDPSSQASNAYSKSSQNLSCLQAPSTSSSELETFKRLSNCEDSNLPSSAHKHSLSLTLGDKPEDHNCSPYHDRRSPLADR